MAQSALEADMRRRDFLGVLSSAFDERNKGKLTSSSHHASGRQPGEALDATLAGTGKTQGASRRMSKVWICNRESDLSPWWSANSMTCPIPVFASTSETSRRQAYLP